MLSECEASRRPEGRFAPLSVTVGNAPVACSEPLPLGRGRRLLLPRLLLPRLLLPGLLLPRLLLLPWLLLPRLLLPRLLRLPRLLLPWLLPGLRRRLLPGGLWSAWRPWRSAWLCAGRSLGSCFARRKRPRRPRWRRRDRRVGGQRHLRRRGFERAGRRGLVGGRRCERWRRRRARRVCRGHGQGWRGRACQHDRRGGAGRFGCENTRRHDERGDAQAVEQGGGHADDQEHAIEYSLALRKVLEAMHSSSTGLTAAPSRWMRRVAVVAYLSAAGPAVAPSVVAARWWQWAAAVACSSVVSAAALTWLSAVAGVAPTLRWPAAVVVAAPT